MLPNMQEAAFTPGSALLGGALIGLAAALLALANGRVAGISGILAGLLRPQAGDVGWRWAFLGGLALAAAVIQGLAPWLGGLPGWPALVAGRSGASTALLVVAGLLVGWGTRQGSGCTSGHGVCGMARLSPRSIVATLCFMATGVLSVGVLRHFLWVGTP
ncbi:MAG: hypothetical protein RI907_1640 [Pseudomonadota bacterium]|jgi:uncharacterized membrane protein YedE/YeeE